MDVFYEHSYRVDSRDMDLFGHCRPSAVLGILQEAATQAAGELGLSGPEVRDRYNAFWMLARIRYELKRPLCWDELVTVKTWHRGGKDRGGGAGGTGPFRLGPGGAGQP